MTHPKMRFTYVGIDSHKATHTAVFLDCFFEKLGEITFGNLPVDFEHFLTNAQKFLIDGTAFMFGLEDCSMYGRTLMRYLVQKGYSIKHVASLLVARERKNRNTSEKTDSVDAECAARVLLSKFGELPDANPQDQYWVLRTLVVRRASLTRHNNASKHLLHDLLLHHYPNYRDFFANIDCKTALAFYARYPSPGTLAGTSLEALAAFLEIPSNGYYGIDKAAEILESCADTAVEHQAIRDEVVQSIVKQVAYNMEEIERVTGAIEAFMQNFDCTLTSINGIDTVSAAQLLSCIGDVRKFSTPAKLARYAGIAPVTRASGKSDIQYANQRGNRELNHLFFNLAIRLTMTAGPKRRVINAFCYDYYHRKRAEGKTKRQALKCVQRRLVNIVWTMLTNNEEYVNPPMYNVPPKVSK